MTTTPQDKADLNDLLETVILKLLNLAEDEVEDVTDKKFQLGSLRGLKNMKADLAKRSVEFALKRIGASNAEQKFRLIVKLSNEHLDKFVDAIGEDRIVNRLIDIDEIVDEDSVNMLEQAGATKLASLLRKALSSAPAIAATATVAGGAVAASKTVTESDNQPESQATEDSPGADFMAAAEDKAASAAACDEGNLALLKEQLTFMTELRDSVDTAIQKIQEAISAAEQINHDNDDPAMESEEEQHQDTPFPIPGLKT